VRALEIVMTTGKPVPAAPTTQKTYLDLEIKWIGINPPSDKLEKKIQKRLIERLKNGMLKEVQALRKNGLSWKRLESFGLEYKFCALYLQNKLSREEMEQQLFTAIRQYAKRQMTWWKRNKNIEWTPTP
jgi:tRNA dimethylallyltransferase